MTDRAIVKLRIRGAVQRVGYRVWIERLCVAAVLDGWVRNRSDGSVEVVLAGPREAVVRIIESCRRGPTKAQVTNVDVAPCGEDELALRGPGVIFDVLPTM
jgi:acylphosphatase